MDAGGVRHEQVRLARSANQSEPTHQHDCAAIGRHRCNWNMPRLQLVLQRKRICRKRWGSMPRFSRSAFRAGLRSRTAFETAIALPITSKNSPIWPNTLRLFITRTPVLARPPACSLDKDPERLFVPPFLHCNHAHCAMQHLYSECLKPLRQ